MRWVVASVVATGAVAAGGIVWASAHSSTAAPKAVEKVQRVASGSVTAKGTVQPISSQSLSFAISGTVAAVNVKAGDVVAVGKVLATLDQTDAKQAVADAQSTLDDAKAALSSAQASASATPSASASSSSSSSSSKSGTSGGGNSGNGGSSLLTLEEAVNNDTAALAKAKRELAGTTITAPVAGKILTVGIKVGDTARSNALTLAVVSTMVVKASFSEADVVGLTIGQDAAVTLAGHTGTTYTAKITQIAETATVSSNLVTYAVVLTFDSVPDGVLVGQSANVTVVNA